MNRSAAGGETVRFGPFEADLESRELRKEGRTVKLQDQPFCVLALLLTHAGQVVTREQLHQALWPADTFVEFDHGLNTAIKKLRQALDDSAGSPRYIETLPRQGYRFIGATSRVEQAAAVERAGRPRLIWLGLAVAASLLAGMVWVTIDREAEDHVQPVPVTTYPGGETVPTLSPDGTQVAFTWDGDKRDNFDIYVKGIAAEAAHRLTTDPGLDFGASWSPDGNLIAFLRPLTPEATGVFVISPSGGVETKVGEVGVAEDFLVGPYLAWSRDSKWLFTDDKTANGSYAIFLLSVETGEKRRLTYPPQGSAGDGYPVISPDNKQLAFTRFGPGPINTVQVQPLGADLTTAGDLKLVYSDDRWMAPATWMPNGREILFTHGDVFSEEPELWRVAVSGRPSPRRLGFAGSGSCCAVFSRDGQRLVYSRLSCPHNLYRLDLRKQSGTSFIKLANSTRVSGEPDFSPDGRRIVFVSSRSGSPEIWVCDRDGQNLVKLTSFEARELAYPRWSPDGRQIGFSMRQAGGSNTDIFTVRTDGGELRRLTGGRGNNSRPAWSHDGRWIYYDSDRTGEPQVWKMREDGQGSVQVTAHGGLKPEEDHDGQFLYYLRITGTGEWDTTSLWEMPLPGGSEHRVLEESIWVLNYATTSKGIYYVPVDFGPVGISGSKIKFLERATGRLSHIASAAHWPMMGLTVSPDGEFIVDSEADMFTGDLMKVDQYR
jgi:Tol biopolymer transport system component/DNA-binding winged helix-turn-helix (wHTH) protein